MNRGEKETAPPSGVGKSRREFWFLEICPPPRRPLAGEAVLEAATIGLFAADYPTTLRIGGGS